MTKAEKKQRLEELETEWSKVRREEMAYKILWEEASERRRAILKEIEKL